MGRISSRMMAMARLAVLFGAQRVHAQLSNLPTLSTATQTGSSSSGSASASAPSDSSGSSGSASSTAASSSGAPTTSTSSANPSTTASATTTFGVTGISGSSTSIFHLSGLPTVEGAGIPTLVIPYTANAPFMQKSNLPEGTVFIAVGAVLAFLGACVLIWRALVAWSINRSVKKAALASVRGSEKTSTRGGSRGYNPAKGSLYEEVGGSGLSLDALTSSGKPVNAHSHQIKEHEMKREATPPAGLFFSPTAQAGSGNRDPAIRSSAYLPAGYYASPSAQAAGGAGGTHIGGSLAPYARHSTHGPSPPASPGLRPTTGRSSTTYRATSRDGLRAPNSRDGYGSARNSYLDARPRSGHASGLYMQPSSSSLVVGVGAASSVENLGGSRAPSAYLEDLFENHGHGPRERF